jgi:hypothetical protein
MIAVVGSQSTGKMQSYSKAKAHFYKASSENNSFQKEKASSPEDL